MNIAGLPGLIKDIEFAFGLPLVGFGMWVINIKLSRSSRFDALKLRIGLSFCLFLFAALFTVLTFQDRAVLATIWRMSPVLYTVVYAIFGILILAMLTSIVSSKLRPSSWHLRNPETNA
jgi:hypothetical protein